MRRIPLELPLRQLAKSQPRALQDKSALSMEWPPPDQRQTRRLHPQHSTAARVIAVLPGDKWAGKSSKSLEEG